MATGRRFSQSDARDLRLVSNLSFITFSSDLWNKSFILSSVLVMFMTLMSYSPMLTTPSSDGTLISEKSSTNNEGPNNVLTVATTDTISISSDKVIMKITESSLELDTEGHVDSTTIAVVRNFDLMSNESLLDEGTSNSDCTVESSSVQGTNATEECMNIKNDTSYTTIELIYNKTARTCEESLCLSESESTENCYCDENCYFYGDCCYTMIEKIWQESNTTESVEMLFDRIAKNLENTTLMFRPDLISCIGGDNNGDAFFMVSNCDSVSMGIEQNMYAKYKEKCLVNQAYSYNNVPVDHTGKTEILVTFKNIYCALCNGIPVEELAFWKIRVKCNSTIGIEITTEMTLSEIETIPSCIVQPFPPNEKFLRHCHIDEGYFRRCATKEQSEVIAKKSLCDFYIYPLVDTNVDYKDPSNVYRNPHCATCATNNSDMNNMTCVLLGEEGLHITEGGNGLANKAPSFPYTVDLQVIFDFSREKEIVATLSCGFGRECNGNQIYDCVSKTCKQLYCPLGQQPIEGKCINEPGGVGNNFPTYTEIPTDLSQDTGKGDIMILEISFGGDILDDEQNKAAYTILDNIQDIISNKNNSTFQIEECVCIMTHNYGFNTAASILQDIYQALPIQSLLGRVQRILSNVEIVITLRNYKSLELLECTDGKLIIDNSTTVVDDKQRSISMFNLSFLPKEVPEYHAKWQISYDKKVDMMKVELLVTCLKDHDSPKINCSTVAYDISNVLLQNESAIILSDGLVFSTDQFMVYNNQVFVCLEALMKYQGFINVFRYMGTHRILSIVTSSLTIVSVVVIIISHICLKRLRNIHGLNISAMSSVILCIHVLLLGQPSISTGTICIIYAITLHFLVLYMFSWMSIIGFDMTRIISGNQIVSRSDPKKRFVKYVFLSVVIPLLLIVACGSLEFTNSSFKPDYGRGVCWLSNGKAIVAFVIAPVVVSLISNTMSFSFTIRSIRRKSKQTRMVRSSVERAYFIVYIKLTIILGFTWIFGVIGGFVREDWLWIMHMVLNGVQGLSLLVCSLVNARIVRMISTSLKFTRIMTDSDLIVVSKL